MRIKVKICGITNSEDALNSAAAGCDAIGFVFYKKSPRYISPLKAREIALRLPKRILKVGVFVNASKRAVLAAIKTCTLDMLQFHGNESVEFCHGFKSYKVIKAFRIKAGLDRQKMLKYQTFAYLFDTFSKSSFGGTGKSFDYKIISPVKGLKAQVFLSGGLSAQNLRQALKVVRPDWLDVSSSVEEKPGKKDKYKIKRFMQALESIRISRCV